MFIVQQLAFLSVLHGCLLFQSQAAAQAAASRGSIRGVVRDASSGAPLPNVSVAAAGVSATTDSQGGYTLRGVKPGSLQIAASVPDSLGPVYKTVSLLEGQDLTGVDIRFTSMARISGAITDEDGKPLAGITVYLVGRDYAFGALRYLYSGSATTGEDGRYALPHVPPTRGFLLLARKETATLKAVSEAPADPKLREPVLPPTYYPSATDIGAAAPLILSPGENREFVDMKMARSPSYCISGTVRSGAGSPHVGFGILESQPVSLFGLAMLDAAVTHRVADNVIRPGGSSQGTAGPDGKIRLCGLHPGSYELTAESGDSFGVQEVTISDHDVSDVLATAETPMPVSGEIVWDGAASDPPVKDHATVLYGPIRSGNGLLMPAEAPIPGSFQFRTPLVKDDYIVALNGLPSGVYLKDITYGGRSMINAFIPVGTAANPPVIRFVLARDGGRVTVIVGDSDGKPVCDADVVLMPVGAGSEVALSSMLISGQTDSFGTWTSQTVAPGKYYVLAGFLPVDRSPESVGKLWRGRTKTEAEQIEVGAGEMVHLRLRPAEVE